jgi:hypothetical protein
MCEPSDDPSSIKYAGDPMDIFEEYPSGPDDFYESAEKKGHSLFESILNENSEVNQGNILIASWSPDDYWVDAFTVNDLRNGSSELAEKTKRLLSNDGNYAVFDLSSLPKKSAIGLDSEGAPYVRVNKDGKYDYVSDGINFFSIIDGTVFNSAGEESSVADASEGFIFGVPELFKSREISDDEDTEFVISKKKSSND